MLVRRDAPAEPGVVGDVDEDLGAVLSVLARQLREDGLVADEDARVAERVPERRLILSTSESAEVLEPLEPVGIEKGNALDDWNEEFLSIWPLRREGSRRIGRHRRVEDFILLLCAGRQRRLELHVEHAEQNWGARERRERPQRVGPIRVLHQVSGKRDLGPYDELRPPSAEPIACKAGEDADNTIAVVSLPLFFLRDVRLNDRDRRERL